jgi:hypothetical protein
MSRFGSTSNSLAAASMAASALAASTVPIHFAACDGRPTSPGLWTPHVVAWSCDRRRAAPQEHTLHPSVAKANEAADLGQPRCHQMIIFRLCRRTVIYSRSFLSEHGPDLFLSPPAPEIRVIFTMDRGHSVRAKTAANTNSLELLQLVTPQQRLLANGPRSENRPRERCRAKVGRRKAPSKEQREFT